MSILHSIPILSLFAITASASLAGAAAGHWLEYRHFPENAAFAVHHANAPALAPPIHDKSGHAFVHCNMFAARCPADPAPVPMATLPVRLIALHIADNHQQSAAILEHADNRAGSYGIGDSVFGLGTVSHIGATTVDVSTVNQRPARLRMAGATESTTAARRADEAAFLQRARAGITQTGKHLWRVERALLEEVLASSRVIRSSGRIVPFVRDGQFSGLTFRGVRPGSLYTALGIENGDTITAVNGGSVSDSDAMLNAYVELKRGAPITVSLMRDGRAHDQTYVFE
jgi:type II secretory pathway component PulC